MGMANELLAIIAEKTAGNPVQRRTGMWTMIAPIQAVNTIFNKRYGEIAG